MVTVNAEIIGYLTDMTLAPTLQMGPIKYSFDVIFKSPCLPPYSILVPQAGSPVLSASYNYYITDPILNLLLPRYQISPTNSLCPNNDIIYNLIEKTGSAINPAIFSFDSIN